jgi:hypothetical protein
VVGSPRAAADPLAHGCQDDPAGPTADRMTAKRSDLLGGRPDPAPVEQVSCRITAADLADRVGHPGRCGPASPSRTQPAHATSTTQIGSRISTSVDQA